MLTISRALLDKIIEHARKDHPDEACGVIAGPAGSDSPGRFIPMLNAERSPTFYRFDSREQLRVWRAMDDNDEEAVVIYHSHTATEAYPSRTDISYAGRAAGPLRPSVDAGRDGDRVPLVPDPRRRGHRGTRHDARNDRAPIWVPSKA